MPPRKKFVLIIILPMASGPISKKVKRHRHENRNKSIESYFARTSRCESPDSVTRTIIVVDSSNSSSDEDDAHDPHADDISEVEDEYHNAILVLSPFPGGNNSKYSDTNFSDGDEQISDDEQSLEIDNHLDTEGDGSKVDRSSTSPHLSFHQLSADKVSNESVETLSSSSLSQDSSHCLTRYNLFI